MIKIRIQPGVAEESADVVKKADDVPPGQLYLNDSEEITEFNQNGGQKAAGGAKV